MFKFIFTTTLRQVGVPLMFLLFFLSRTPEPSMQQTVFAGINLVLTISTILMLVWQLFKLIPNLALFRRRKIIQLIIEIVIEILALVGFWLAFIIMFY